MDAIPILFALSMVAWEIAELISLRDPFIDTMPRRSD